MYTDIRVKMATTKQFAFLKTLVAERDLDSSLTDWVRDSRARAQNGGMTSHEASSLISALLDRPKKTISQPKADEPDVGVYLDAAGRILRVYAGQKSGCMLAKQVIVEDGEFVRYDYVGRAAGRVTAQQRLSLEEVGQMGVATGSCLLCGRRLDDPESVDRGVGPVCAGKY